MLQNPFLLKSFKKLHTHEKRVLTSSIRIFQLRKENTTDDLMKKVCAKMLLYARQNKNNSNFDFAIGFFGIISLSGYHSLLSEQDF